MLREIIYQTQHFLTMRLDSIVFLCLLFFSTCAINAQKQAVNNPQEETLIRQTIATYFEGWMTGDTTKLGRAMHTTCQLKNIKDDGVIIFDRATYLGFFKPRPRRENAGGRVVSINITDDIAAAKCEIYTADRLYTDYFNMMKVKGEWYIVDKIATNKAKE